MNEEYNKLIERIFNRFPSYQVVGGNAYHPGLEKMMEFDALLGHPHRRYRTIHVAGTNGKGSVSNMIAAALDAMGYRVGLYTSPHLLDFRERSRIVGEGLVSEEKVMEFCRKWWDEIDRLDLSFFEITTALAFDWFAEEEVDIAVIETGLGGRLDSTNIIRPELSVITNIGLDHCNILGDTIAQIAAEKAGIIKEGVPALVGESGEESDIVFRAKADTCSSALSFAERDFDFPESLLASLLVEMDLKGCYQRKNLRTALSALTVLHRAGLVPKSATSEAVLDALKHTAAVTGFHGRWETIATEPLTIGDIGHNAHGRKYNFAQLRRMVEEEGYELVMVYGSVADKDWKSVVRMIPRCARAVVFTNASGSRALPAGEALREFERQNAESLQGRYTEKAGVEVPKFTEKGVTGVQFSGEAFACGNVAEAVALARKLSAGLRKPLIYIGGSTYVLSEAIKAL